MALSIDERRDAAARALTKIGLHDAADRVSRESTNAIMLCMIRDKVRSLLLMSDQEHLPDLEAALDAMALWWAVAS